MDTIHPLKVLREYRKNQDPPLSQGDLAGQLSVVRETVARWESGIRKIDQTKVPEVSKVTGIPVEVLRPDLARVFAKEAAE